MFSIIFVFLSYSNLCQYRNFIIWNFVDKYWDQELRRLCSYSTPLPLPLENRIYSNCQYSSLCDFSVRTMYSNRQSCAKYDPWKKYCTEEENNGYVVFQSNIYRISWGRWWGMATEASWKIFTVKTTCTVFLHLQYTCYMIQPKEFIDWHC